MNEALDTLELELRRLPGIVGVGYSDEGDTVVVHVLADVPQVGPSELRRQVSQRARAHLDKPLVIEVEDLAAPRPTRYPARVRLDGVRVDAFSQELDVHLALGSRRVVGRGEAGSPAEAAAATLVALAELGAELPFRIDAATAALRQSPDHAVVVVLEPDERAPKLYGVARAPSMEEAAARATLHALNRYLSRDDAFVPSSS
ncbi:MAG TPA: hypothetical protein VM938_10245 [Acidimicrobiales bacterium]|nr:hypothetical protein [Acidimicrobiales bacterium]